MNRRDRRQAIRQKVGTHTAICVVCGKPIPRRHVAMWVTDKWTGKIYGSHMACGDGPQAQKAVLVGLKEAMTTPEWIRFRWRQRVMGHKRTWAKFASRWKTSPKMIGADD